MRRHFALSLCIICITLFLISIIKDCPNELFGILNDVANLRVNSNSEYLRYQLFVMFNSEYAQITKIKRSVSLQRTTISKSTLEPCNNLFSCTRSKIFFFCWSKNKKKILVEFQNETPEYTILFFDQLIFVFTVVQKPFSVVIL